jgi:hypothetical protein
MIKNFVDKDGQKFNIWLRGAYAYIKSAKKLREVLDNSINAKPQNMREALHKKNYMDVMRYFGIMSGSKRLS